MRHETVETGKLITFEGGEGAGKSTQVAILVERLRTAGRHAIATREPGGSPAAEEIRETLLSGKVKQFGPFAEALLFSIARQDHVDTLIGDALARGQWVVCDRFLDSTRAYQGVSGGVPAPIISALERLTLHGVMPNLTIVLDIPVEEGLARMSRRRGTPDRFESEDIAQHERIRKAFNLLLNRDDIIQLVEEGDALKAAPVPPAHKRYQLPEDDASLVEYFKHDVAEAKSLLDAAAFDYDQEFELKHSNRATDALLSQVIQGQLGEGGVKVSIR